MAILGRRWTTWKLLLIEIDDEWRQGLEPVREDFRQWIDEIRPDGRGIALWSALPLRDHQVECIVADDRPSIHCRVTLPGGEAVRFVGLHPTPPALPKRGAKARHDSRIRDGELMLIGDRVNARPDEQWLVAGDFNDVAWSRTTRMFEKVSGLADPRAGRRMMNTFHAQYKLLRYPLDHVFVSPTFRVGHFDRVRTPGSDHFAVAIDLELAAPEADGVDERASDAEHEEAEEMVAEGVDDAGGSPEDGARRFDGRRARDGASPGGRCGRGQK